jgi:quinol monooxygenase YgiN
MTVLVAGTLDIKAEDRAQAIAAALTQMDDIRAQNGCQAYVWSADPTSETRVCVFENWDSSDALAAHLAGPFYAKMLGILGSYEILGTAISKFKVAIEEPIYDAEGQPRGDFFTE